MSAVRPALNAARSHPAATLAGGLALAALAWAFWPTLQTLAERWAADPRYSHGYLVPLFSLYLLWRRRDVLARKPAVPSWVGLPVLLGGLALHAVGTAVYLEWFAAAALLPCLAGVVLLAGGWRALKWAWPAVAFLAFMVPLPYRLEVALAQPLQGVATQASTYILQTLGFVAVAEGNVIRLGETRLGVVEACSGLSMLIIFFALSTAVAVVMRGSRAERVLVVASAAPVALLVNIVRIVVTGVLYKTAGDRVAEYVFHDLAGWLMMPLALGCLWAELRLVRWVVIDRPAPPARPALAPTRGFPIPAPAR